MPESFGHGICLSTPRCHRIDLGSVIDPTMEDAALKSRNSLEQSLEIYLERIDDLVVKVVNSGEQMLEEPEHVFFAEDVKDVVEKCAAYRVAKRAADHCRDLNILSADEARMEGETRMAFAAACKALDDKWTELMVEPIACGCDAGGKECRHPPGQCQNHALVPLAEQETTQLGICQECWDSGGVFRVPASKKPARRGAVA